KRDPNRLSPSHLEPNCLSPSQRTQSSPTLSISRLADDELIWFIGFVDLRLML
ncbi:unnamed protein product, partial [Brassica oleracea]